MTMTHAFQPKSPMRSQSGAALLLAMVIVTLVATISASMVWQQWRAVQVEGAERVRSQAAWVLSGALDWARLILREDSRNGGPDHLGEIWATPLAEARLSTFLASDSSNTTDADADADAPEAFLSGQTEDVTAHYNLRNVVSADGDIIPEELAVLKRLFENAGQPPSLADGLAQAFRRALLSAVSVQSDNPIYLEKLGGESAREAAPLMPQSFDQIVWLGIDAATLERMRPYLTMLPDGTQVNVNTAPKEVIAAVVPGLDLARASRLVQVRQRAAFKTTDEVVKTLGPGKWDMGRLNVKSDWFEVRGRLRLDDNVIEQHYLVNRSGDDVTVRSQSRFSGVDRGTAPSLNP